MFKKMFVSVTRFIENKIIKKLGQAIWLMLPAEPIYLLDFYVATSNSVLRRSKQQPIPPWSGQSEIMLQLYGILIARVTSRF